MNTNHITIFTYEKQGKYFVKAIYHKGTKDECFSTYGPYNCQRFCDSMESMIRRSYERFIKH